MQKYECVFILRADLPEGEMAKRVDRVAAIVGSHDGEVTFQDHWGVRKLAYEIEKLTKGDYMLLRFKSKGGAVAEIDRYLRQDDQVLRHLVVVDEEWEERNRVAMAKRRQQMADEEAVDNQE
ncbi:MAG: 30S ribosomal protein S6 [Candidatus Krumholzibacteriia bacterium]